MILILQVADYLNADTPRVLCYKDLFLRNQAKRKGQAT
jgi:hypothetical protein